MRKCYINKRKMKLIAKRLFKAEEVEGVMHRYSGKFMFMTSEPYTVLVQGDEYRSAPPSCLKFIGKRT